MQLERLVLIFRCKLLKKQVCLLSARHLVRYAWPSNKNIIVQIAKEDYRTKGIEKIEFTCYFMHELPR